jgi:hypothetical protein
MASSYHPFPEQAAAIQPALRLFTTSAESTRRLQVTPAMESKLTDHVWEIGELLA